MSSYAPPGRQPGLPTGSSRPPRSEPERPRYDPLPRYVAQIVEQPDDSIDLVMVDGHYRGTCIRAAPPKLKPGGLLLADDVNLWSTREAIPVPPDWEEVDRSTNGLKIACIWRKPRTGADA